MQPPDPEHGANAPIQQGLAPRAERAERGELPDDTSRSENGPISTEFEPGTGRRMTTGVVIAAGFLVLGFLAVGTFRFFDQRAVAKQIEAANALDRLARTLPDAQPAPAAARGNLRALRRARGVASLFRAKLLGR